MMVEKEVKEVDSLTLCSLGIVGANQNLFMLAIIAAWKERMDALKPCLLEQSAKVLTKCHL